MSDHLNLEQLRRAEVERTLAACNGRVRPAASLLGISYGTLYRWIKQWKREDRAREREAKRATSTEE